MRWLPAGWLPMLVLLLAGCANGLSDSELRVSATAEIARRPEFYTNGEARAWVVSKDGAERGLLWGTLHLSYGGDTVLPGPIRARFSAAADLTVETAIDRLPSSEFRDLRIRFQAANQKHDKAAWDRLAPPIRTAAERSLRSGEAEARSLRGIAGLITGRSVAELADHTPTVGFVDLNLIGFARNQQRPVFGLERLYIFDRTLDDPNGPDAEASLAHALRREDTGRRLMAWMRSEYGAGDVAGMNAAGVAWRSDETDLRSSDRDRAALLTERNAAWLPRLERIFARPGLHFVAVGAAHLLGTDGLVALLRARGYTVVPCIRDVCT